MTMTLAPQTRSIAEPAYERSGLAGHVLIQAEHEVPDHDPWDWFAQVGPIPEPAVIWHEPSRNLTFAAIGSVLAKSFAGAERFAEANHWCSKAREQVIALPSHAPGKHTPLFVGGFAFDGTEASQRGAWQGWPGGRIWIPRVLVMRQDGVSRAVFREQLRPGLDPRAWLDRHIDALIKTHLPQPARPSVEAWNEESDGSRRTEYCAGVKAALEGLGTENLSKLVLARDASLRTQINQRFDPVATARNLREEHPDCTTFAFRRPDGATFLGATPELLVESRANQARTVALAGTRARGKDADEDARLAKALAASPKDQQEHRWVVDALKEALLPLSEHLDVPDHPRVRQLSKLFHLETVLNADLVSNPGILSLVDRLHPSPAVGGTPRRQALAWLTANEPVERGWYAGPVGWIDEELSGSFHVALRVALLKDSQATAFAGAGLVVGSNPEAEWEETEHKLGAIRRALVATKDVES